MSLEEKTDTKDDLRIPPGIVSMLKGDDELVLKYDRETKITSWYYNGHLIRRYDNNNVPLSP